VGPPILLSSSNEATNAHHDVTQSTNGIATAVAWMRELQSQLELRIASITMHSTHNQDMANGLAKQKQEAEWSRYCC
jgi:hypothetical protein